MSKIESTARTLIYRHKRSEHVKVGTFSIHTHNTYELIYFLGGNATHVIEDRKYKLKKGDLIIVRPLQYHFIQIDSSADYERFNILFDPQMHRIEGVELIPDRLEVINLTSNPIADNIFQKCDLYRKEYSKESFHRLLSHLISELFYNISLFAGEHEGGETASLSPLISSALRYINENLCTVSGIKEIAAHLFISESYLFRIFKTELHQTPKNYILGKRLTLAQKKILSGEKPSAVATECGFGDYTVFYRNYVARFGHSPSQKT